MVYTVMLSFEKLIRKVGAGYHSILALIRKSDDPSFKPAFCAMRSIR